MDLRQYLASRKDEFEQALNRSLVRELPSLAPKLHEAMNYSLTAGGKRIRPILALAACEAAGGKRQTALPLALALEYVHTYSLIHDDLPAMDDDDLRRGKPTSHKVFGEATAILAGDALLTDAFRLIARSNSDLSNEARLEGVRILAEAAGENGMVGGQLLDLEGEDKPLTLKELRNIHSNKTGRLLCAAVELGALAAGADKQLRRALVKYGQAIGYAFQLKDDLLDQEQSQTTGKDSGSDLKNKKATVLSLMQPEEAQAELARQLEEALKAIQQLDARAEPLREIARYIVTRGN